MTEEEFLQQSRHHLQDSVIHVCLRIFFAAFLIDTLFAIILIFMVNSTLASEYPVQSFVILWVAQTVKFIGEMIIILRILIDTMASNYYLTETELITYRGVLNPEEEVHSLKDIRAIQVRESWLGRLFNYGDLILTIDNRDLELTGIANPRRYERLLRLHQPISKKVTSSP